MTVRDFISAAYAVFVGEYQRIGTDLQTAVEKLEASLGLRAAPAGVPITEAAPSVADNDRALAELTQAMGGRKRR